MQAVRGPALAFMMLVLGMLILECPASRASETPKRVLLLDSFGRDVAPISTVISVFRTELSMRSPEPIDLHEVSLEMARFAEPGQEAPFVNFLRERFSGYTPDLVVAVGSPAFSFLVRHREVLFESTSVLIAGVAEQVLRAGPVIGNAALLPLEIDLKGMISDILQVLPGTRNIYVVLGDSALEQFWVSQCRSEFSIFSGRLRFVYLDHLSFDAIKTRLAALPPDSAVVYALLIKDVTGTLLDPGEALKTIIAEANAPVFAFFQSFFGSGTVGGRLVQDRDAGMFAAKAAIRILGGSPPAGESMPPARAGLPVYDWRALKRWGIDVRKLPEGSRVDFREPSLWERYHWHITGGALLLILQAVLIARLLIQRKRRDAAECELARSEHRLRLITNAMPVLIAHVDADQRYRFTNEAYRAWFGFSPEEALGRTIREVVGEPFYRSVLPYVERVLSGERIQYAQDIDMEDGRILSIEAIYVPDANDRGVVNGFYALVMDMTEQRLAHQESRRLQDELLHAGRIATMGELAGALAHEINQPLSAIMSNAQAARRFLNAPTPEIEEVNEILDDIVKDDARAGDVINRLRRMLKKTKPVLEPVDLNAIFREVAGLLHSDAVIRNVRVCFELDPLLPPVSGDRVQLQQVALNLVLNAFEALEEVPRESRRVRIRTRLEGVQILAAVEDTGKGIPPEASERIFDSYYTTKLQGLGMGLSISRSVLQRHKGRIWFENRHAGGVTFYFSLPAAAEGDLPE